MPPATAGKMPAATKMRASLKFTCRITLSQSIAAHPLPKSPKPLARS